MKKSIHLLAYVFSDSKKRYKYFIIFLHFSLAKERLSHSTYKRYFESKFNLS